MSDVARHCPSTVRCAAGPPPRGKLGEDHDRSVGPLGGGRIDHVGAKITFGRIPEVDEFRE